MARTASRHGTRHVSMSAAYGPECTACRFPPTGVHHSRKTRLRYECHSLGEPGGNWRYSGHRLHRRRDFRLRQSCHTAVASRSRTKRDGMTAASIRGSSGQSGSPKARLLPDAMTGTACGWRASGLIWPHQIAQ
jgi:hypothetical protein